jgi:hypothetical protein
MPRNLVKNRENFSFAFSNVITFTISTGVKCEILNSLVTFCNEC